MYLFFPEINFFLLILQLSMYNHGFIKRFCEGACKSKSWFEEWRKRFGHLRKIAGLHVGSVLAMSGPTYTDELRLTFVHDFPRRNNTCVNHFNPAKF
jgi:hypothetical protein